MLVEAQRRYGMGAREMDIGHGIVREFDRDDVLLASGTIVGNVSYNGHIWMNEDRS